VSELVWMHMLDRRSRANDSRNGALFRTCGREVKGGVGAFANAEVARCPVIEVLSIRLGSKLLGRF
jgi:hypothetical protein